MMREKEGWAVFIIVAVGAGLLVYAAAHAVGQLLSIQSGSFTNYLSVDTLGWQTYQNFDYGFSVKYPPDWQLSIDGLTNQTPFVAIGNPIEGTSTYTLQIFIENNSSSLSSGAYVHQFLAADKAQDIASGVAQGQAPQVTPQYQESYLLNVGSYEAYELSSVFEFDHDADQIYVAHGNVALHFDFPSGQEDPNISLPVANNTIAHEIVDTLSF